MTYFNESDDLSILDQAYEDVRKSSFEEMRRRDRELSDRIQRESDDLQRKIAASSQRIPVQSHSYVQNALFLGIVLFLVIYLFCLA